MDGTAVKEIAALKAVEQKTVVIDGKTYTDRDLKLIVNDSRPAPLKFLSLTALFDYVREKCEDISGGKVFFLVDNINHVSLVQEFSGERKTRTVFAEVNPITTDTFPFTKWMDIESMIINAKTYFLPGDDLDEIISLLSSVSKDSSVDTKDDGVTQQVNVRVGLRGALTEKKDSKGIFKMAARRIFPEVDQPVSDFIFRMKASDPVMAAIFESDGGAWKLQALENIGNWLKSQGLGIPVLA